MQWRCLTSCWNTCRASGSRGVLRCADSATALRRSRRSSSAALLVMFLTSAKLPRRAVDAVRSFSSTAARASATATRPGREHSRVLISSRTAATTLASAFTLAGALFIGMDTTGVLPTSLYRGRAMPRHIARPQTCRTHQHRTAARHDHVNNRSRRSRYLASKFLEPRLYFR
jgi:hypothetical protein